MPLLNPRKGVAGVDRVLKRVTDTNYTATAVDYPIEVDSTVAPVQITLPASLALGQQFRIAWLAGFFPVTITSSDVISRPVERSDGSAGATASMSGIGEVFDFYISQNRFKRT
jgi:hypothetical protein